MHHQIIGDRLRKTNDTGLGFREKPGLLFWGVLTNDEVNMSAHIDPERKQFDAFKALSRDLPVMMLNLVRLRDKAAYEDGRDAIGAEAYAAYGRESAPVFQRVGGDIVWRGRPENVLIGPGDEHWDIAFIARYPTAGAFLEMVTDPDYRVAVKHRQAAVLDSRLIRTGEVDEGSGFAG
jgi:uncharacterized protein (DUF1330 family)